MSAAPGPHFDCIVVGSGYGATVSALAQGERGRSVLILERGTWWQPKPVCEHTRPPEFLASRPALQPTQELPETFGGCVDAYAAIDRGSDRSWRDAGPAALSLPLCLYRFRDCAVVTANAVGGASLIDAGILYEPAFDRGTNRYPAMDAWPEPARLRDVDYQRGRRWLAEHATDGSDSTAQEGRCARRLCVLGCRLGRPRSLDGMLLWHMEGEKHIVVRPLANVEYIEPTDAGYAVTFAGVNYASRHTVTCARLILAAGALGTTEILLRSQARCGARLRFSPLLGLNLSLVGVPAPLFRAAGHSNAGAPLSDAVDLAASDEVLQRGSSPSAGQLPLVYVPHVHRLATLGAGAGRLAERGMLEEADGAGHTPASVYAAPLNVEGRLSHSGRLLLADDGTLRLDHHSTADTEPPAAAALPIFTDVVGGCAMGDDSSLGVVNAAGEVFDAGAGGTSVHGGLYVVDASIVPGPVDVEPSLTVIAIALRIAASIN